MWLRLITRNVAETCTFERKRYKSTIKQPMTAHWGLPEIYGQLYYTADHVTGEKERTHGSIPALSTEAAASMQRVKSSNGVLTVPASPCIAAKLGQCKWPHAEHAHCKYLYVFFIYNILTCIRHTTWEYSVTTITSYYLNTCQQHTSRTWQCSTWG